MTDHSDLDRADMRLDEGRSLHFGGRGGFARKGLTRAERRKQRTSGFCVHDCLNNGQIAQEIGNRCYKRLQNTTSPPPPPPMGVLF